MVSDVFDPTLEDSNSVHDKIEPQVPNTSQNEYYPETDTPILIRPSASSSTQNDSSSSQPDLPPPFMEHEVKLACGQFNYFNLFHFSEDIVT